MALRINIKKKVTHKHKSPQHAEILAALMKLSELPAATAAIEAKVDSLATKLDAFLAVAGDPPIPADAEAALTRTSEKLAAAEAKIPAA